jgi:prepilin-type N-terminal cleavage/methylation domain-containing protein
MMRIGECVAPHCKRLRLTQPPLQLNETIVQTKLTRHNTGAMRQRIVGRLCQTPVCPRPAFHRNALQGPRDEHAFTLIELLVVIAIIAILIGLLFPAFRAVQDQAKRTQAKNDLTQIVTAVNAYYTEYGKYPLGAGITTDTTFGPGGSPATNQTLFTELRGCTAAAGSCPAAAVINPRQIAFISPPDVKDPAKPRSGIGTAVGNLGQYFDPWGSNYVIRIDGGYDNSLPNPYTVDTGAGPGTLTIGVIAWSLGKDGLGGSGAKTATPPGPSDDDVISWQ